ncbi:uroplakin-1a-like [Erpetoichthys calabaricus]|uniref:Uroplakin 1a n=1 Tax=Erpetoichthys calabaricus TaxID=27687 RepID=A0A8C4T140_ERPCA|nr:uroplakin-1a-like [Erpetoichthys calabaricus]
MAMSDEEKGGSVGLKALLVFCNVIIALCGLTLYAETIWVATDAYKVYPIVGVTGKDDIFAGAWIAIFTGFAFFCTAIYGIFALIQENRLMVVLYLGLLLIVYIFECASAITSFTHRDYMVSSSNLIKKQMLRYYTDNSTPGQLITNTWNKIMLGQQCCGTDGPLDWINYNSTFSATNTAPWPLNCCVRLRNFEVADQGACYAGDVRYVLTDGCFSYIAYSINRYTWGVSWFGFAILLFTLPVMLLAMLFYVRI